LLPKIKLIINPFAGNATARKLWPDLKSRLHDIWGDFSWEFTRKRDDATTLTRQALCAGFQTIVAVGGDGTINEVVNGFFDNEQVINSEAALGLLSTGTGGDLIKSLHFPQELPEAAQRIRQRRTRKLDVGKLYYTAGDSRAGLRYFVNIADAGFGGTLIEIVNRSSKALGPFVAYLTGLLRTLTIYTNKPIHITIDDGFDRQMRVNSVVVANAQFFGGGMWIAPEAQTDDGLFDITIIGDLNKREILGNIHKLYNGTLGTHPKVTMLRGRTVTLRSDEEVKLDADGESMGTLPARFEIIPNALNVIV